MYLRNTWYVAAWASEVVRELFHRTILDEPVLLYRKEDGSAVAMADRCPHRFAPLHMGTLKGDSVECGYHGLRFDGSGKCVLNPHGDGRIPQAAKVKAYPLVERDSLLWIWMGDPAKADAAQIPDFAFLADAARGTVGGYLPTKASYLLLVDNLLDLSHTQFVHKGYQDTDAFLRGKHEVVQEGNTVHSNVWAPNGKAAPVFVKRLPSADADVDMWANMRWDPPSCLRLDIGVTLAGRPREEGAVQSLSAHILTPESEWTTHYFYANSRIDQVGDPQRDAAVREWQRVGFSEQDKPMIEAVQRNMGTTDLMSLRPVLLSVDGGAVRARRVLAKLIEQEQNLHATASA